MDLIKSDLKTSSAICSPSISVPFIHPPHALPTLRLISKPAQPAQYHQALIKLSDLEKGGDQRNIMVCYSRVVSTAGCESGIDAREGLSGM